jgi:exosome complex protein LRP1
MNFDFGELKNDVNFIVKLETSSEAIIKIEEVIQRATSMKTESLSIEDRVKLDFFLAYAVNSLFFMYLKVTGDNPASHPIKDELNRIKESLQKHQMILDKKLRPQINSGVAKRFVRGGLFDFRQKNEEFKKRHQEQHKIYIHHNPNPQNRKRKFTD